MLAEMSWLSVAVLTFVTAQRLSELAIARRNTERLLAKGAIEIAPEHYPAIVAVHTAWIAGLWYVGPWSEVNLPLLGVFFLLQLGRLWVLNTLGERWTTRIIVVPGETLVRSGPYQYVSHPNYMVVAGEILVLPLAFGLPIYALIFTVLNAAVLTVRIRAEHAALYDTSVKAPGRP